VTLVEVLRDDVRRRAVIHDGALLIDAEVASRSGLSGLALKAGYKAVKAMRPGIIEHALAALLPEFAPALDPFYERGRAEGDVDAYFRTHAQAIASALLAVTDRRAERGDNGALKRIYATLRSSAHREVAASVPRLGGLIRKHVG
jgi:hypothetical protein